MGYMFYNNGEVKQQIIDSRNTLPAIGFFERLIKQSEELSNDFRRRNNFFKRNIHSIGIDAYKCAVEKVDCCRDDQIRLFNNMFISFYEVYGNQFLLDVLKIQHPDITHKVLAIWAKNSVENEVFKALIKYNVSFKQATLKVFNTGKAVT